MNVRTLLAIAVGTIVTYFIGWLVFDKLLINFFYDYCNHYPGLMKTQTMVWPRVLGHLVWVTLITYVISISKGNRGLVNGLIIGAILAFAVSFSYDLAFYNEWNLYSKRTLVAHVVCNTGISAIIGAIIGWILRD